jgi:acetolactate synthase-1/2/3 large subunit
VVGDETIVVEEAVTSAAALRRTLRRERPGSWLHAGGPGIGWALGAAVGAKLAAPEREVVAVVGDGSFVFGSPIAALWAAQQVHAPFLAVVLNNGGYRASKDPVLKLFPEGASVLANLFPGVRFPTPPDYAALARSCHAYGARVQDPADLTPALARALQAVREGQAAVLDLVMAPI